MTPKETTACTTAGSWESVRRWKRYAIDVRLRIVSSHNGVRTIVYGKGTDVSEGGISAYISMELKLGSTVQMEMLLPYCQQPLKVKARVRSREGLRYGLEFESLTPPEMEAIQRTCRALSLVQ